MNPDATLQRKARDKTFDWKAEIERELDNPWNHTQYSQEPWKIACYLGRLTGEMLDGIRSHSYRWHVRKCAVKVAATAIALYEAHAPNVDEGPDGV